MKIAGQRDAVLVGALVGSEVAVQEGDPLGSWTLPSADGGVGEGDAVFGNQDRLLIAFGEEFRRPVEKFRGNGPSVMRSGRMSGGSGTSSGLPSAPALTVGAK